NLEGRRLHLPELRQCPTKDSVRLGQQGRRKRRPSSSFRNATKPLPSDVARLSWDRAPPGPDQGLPEGPKTERRGGYYPSPVAVPRVAAEMVVGTLLVNSIIVHLILTGSRRSAEHSDGRTHRNGLEKRYRLFLGHSNASVRSRVTRQVT